jgi:hypothetical protein
MNIVVLQVIILSCSANTHYYKRCLTKVLKCYDKEFSSALRVKPRTLAYCINKSL